MNSVLLRPFRLKAAMARLASDASCALLAEIPELIPDARGRIKHALQEGDARSNQCRLHSLASPSALDGRPPTASPTQVARCRTDVSGVSDRRAPKALGESF